MRTANVLMILFISHQPFRTFVLTRGQEASSPESDKSFKSSNRDFRARLTTSTHIPSCPPKLQRHQQTFSKAGTPPQQQKALYHSTCDSGFSHQNFIIRTNANTQSAYFQINPPVHGRRPRQTAVILPALHPVALEAIAAERYSAMSLPSLVY